MLKPRSHRANSAGAFLERWKKTLAPFMKHRIPLVTAYGPSYRSNAQNMAVRKGQSSAPAKLTTALTVPSQSLASLDTRSWTLGSAANTDILNARPPLLLQLCLGGDQTLHKLWWSGCKRTRNCWRGGGRWSSDPLRWWTLVRRWYGGVRGDQSLAINMGENALGTHLELDCIECGPHLHQICLKSQ